MLALVQLVQLVQLIQLVQLVQLVPLQCHTKHLRVIQEEHLGLHGSSSTLSPSLPLPPGLIFILLSGRSKWLESFSGAVVVDEPSIHPLAKQSAYSYFIFIFLFSFFKLLHQMNNPSIRQPSGLPIHCIAWLILLELSKHGMTFCPPHRIKVALYFVNMANCQYVPCWTVWQDIWREHKVLLWSMTSRIKLLALVCQVEATFHRTRCPKSKYGLFRIWPKINRQRANTPQLRK